MTVMTIVKDTTELETIFSPIFTNGVRFYTCHIGGMILWGYLCHEDEFDPNKVRPHIWGGSYGSYGSTREYTNVVTLWNGQDTHLNYHKALVKRLLDRDSNFCPQRLRRHRKLA